MRNGIDGVLQKKGAATEARETVAAAALAVEMGVRPAGVVKAAEAAGALRDERGVLWVWPDQLGAVARHNGRTLANVERMAARAKKRWRPLEPGCEVLRVEQVPGAHKVVVASRLGLGVAGERVTVEVRDSMAYRVGEEIVAKKGAFGWMSREGR